MSVDPRLKSRRFVEMYGGTNLQTAPARVFEWSAIVFLLLTAWLLVLPIQTYADSDTIRVTLDLSTGGGVTGLVVDHNSDAIVVVWDDTPHVFAWDEIEALSAYKARLSLLTLARGREGALLAVDHFVLGRFMLERGRVVLARKEFDRAKRLDPSYKSMITKALRAHRVTKKTTDASPFECEESKKDSPVSIPGEAERVCESLTDSLRSRLTDAGLTDLTPEQVEQLKVAVRDVYDRFGQKVIEELGDEVKVIETEHFLIHTDATPSTGKQIADWAERMYDSLCVAFDFDPAQNVFLAKCPFFCFRSQARYLKFARVFDGYNAEQALGYSRSIERLGHVHIVLRIPDPHDRRAMDRFASTLVHEGAHAFVHRFHKSRLIPHWVNEGLADLTSEEVLKNRCFTGEKTDLLVSQYVKYKWSIGDVLRSNEPLEVHQYQIAQSVVAYMRSLGREKFVTFLTLLKDGNDLPHALAYSYDGLSFIDLERGWRAWVSRNSVSTGTPFAAGFE